MPSYDVRAAAPLLPRKREAPGLKGGSRRPPCSPLTMACPMPSTSQCRAPHGGATRAEGSDGSRTRLVPERDTDAGPKAPSAAHDTARRAAREEAGAGMARRDNPDRNEKRVGRPLHDAPPAPRATGRHARARDGHATTSPPPKAGDAVAYICVFCLSLVGTWGRPARLYAQYHVGGVAAGRMGGNTVKVREGEEGRPVNTVPTPPHFSL